MRGNVKPSVENGPGVDQTRTPLKRMPPERLTAGSPWPARLDSTIKECMKQGPARALEAFEKLKQLALLLAHEAEPGRLVPLILDQAIALVSAERGFVILLESDTGAAAFEVAAARNLDREGIQSPEFKVSKSIAQRVATTGKAELLCDAADDATTRDLTSVRDMSLRSVLCVPLRAHGRTLGVVYVDHRFVKGEFDAEDKALLELFAVPAAIALDAARRTAELKRDREELTRRLGIIERLRAEVVERYRERSREANRLKDASLRRGSGVYEAQLPGIVARSSAMARVTELVRKVAPSDVPVLILGESGTGKELLARAIHALSPRSDRGFLAENCAALAEPLLESELFGYEPGAFTGATKQHPGLFEAASGGTLFLDEVGEMSLGLQAKLLRVLQEKAVRRLGGHEPIPVDVRLVAATNRDVDAMVASGELRADLFYRLNVLRIEVPPLRERIEDVPALIDHFLSRLGSKITLEPAARELLLSYPWPGNVRELENELARLAVVVEAGGVVRPSHLSPGILRPAFGVAAPSSGGSAPAAEPAIEGVWRLEEIEKEMVQRALRAAGGNKTVAARLLGIPKSSLYHRLEKHGI